VHRNAPPALLTGGAIDSRNRHKNAQRRRVCGASISVLITGLEAAAASIVCKERASSACSSRSSRASRRGGIELKQRYSGSGKHGLAASAERLFVSDIIVEAEVKDRAVRWLPNAMRFAAAPETVVEGASTEIEPDTAAVDAPTPGDSPAPLADAA
jgi:hypothetical protein